MRILILGGTGAMGRHLVPLLANGENKVVVTSRTIHNDNKGIEYIKGNAQNLGFLNKVLEKKWDVIIDFMNYSVETFQERVDILLESTSQYIFLSSARVYNGSTEPLTEKSVRLLNSSTDKEFLMMSEYSLNKAKQEDVLYSKINSNWTIIRPYITYSDNRLQLGTLEKENWLYRALNGRTIIFSKDISDHYTTLTYGNDVAKGIMSLIGNENSLAETYHITNNNLIKWSRVLEIYLEVFQEKIGYRPKVIYQSLPEFLDWNPGTYQVIYDRLFDRKFDNTKINQYIDTSAFVDTETGLRKCFGNFLDNPQFHVINWGCEAKKDKIANESTKLKEINKFKQKIKYILYRDIF